MKNIWLFPHFLPIQTLPLLHQMPMIQTQWKFSGTVIPARLAQYLVIQMMTENSAVSAANWVSPRRPCLQGSLKSSWLQEFGCYDKEKMHTTLCGQEIAGKTDFISGSKSFTKNMKKHGYSKKKKKKGITSLLGLPPTQT